VFWVYDFSLFAVIGKNTFLVQLIKFPVKHTKLPYIFLLVLMRNLILCKIKSIFADYTSALRRSCGKEQDEVATTVLMFVVLRQVSVFFTVCCNSFTNVIRCRCYSLGHPFSNYNQGPCCETTHPSNYLLSCQGLSLQEKRRLTDRHEGPVKCS
jgi:hypothetical protein